MNLVTASPALVVVYVGLLMWILMDLHFAALRPSEKVWVPLAAIVLAVGNHLLRVQGLQAAVAVPWQRDYLHSYRPGSLPCPCP